MKTVGKVMVKGGRHISGENIVKVTILIYLPNDFKWFSLLRTIVPYYFT